MVLESTQSKCSSICECFKSLLKIFIFFLNLACGPRWENVSLLRCTDLLLHFGEFSCTFFRNKSHWCTTGPWFHTQCWLLMLAASVKMCIIKMNISDMLTLFYLYTLLQNHFLFFLKHIYENLPLPEASMWGPLGLVWSIDAEWSMKCTFNMSDHTFINQDCY